MKRVALVGLLLLWVSSCGDISCALVERYFEDPLQDQHSIQPHERPLREVPEGVVPTSPHGSGVRVAADLEPAQSPAEAKTLRNPLPASRETLAAGKVGYERYCSHCHGDSGHGWSSVGSSLRPAPPDLVDVITEMSDGEIFSTITSGEGQDLRIPISLGGTVSVDDRWRIIHYLRTLRRERRGKAPHWDHTILRD